MCDVEYGNYHPNEASYVFFDPLKTSNSPLATQNLIPFDSARRQYVMRAEKGKFWQIFET